jgi:deoxyribose-phosphate aldolase
MITTTHHIMTGGIKTAQDAKGYLDLADKILGPEWADARHFRFGASSLLPALLSTLQVRTGANTNARAVTEAATEAVAEACDN